MSGITFLETMSGEVGGFPCAVDLTVYIPNIDEFLESPDHSGLVTGDVRYKEQNYKIYSGFFRLFDVGEDGIKHLEYSLPFFVGEAGYVLDGIKNIKDDPGRDMLADITTLFTQVNGPDTKDRGVLYFSPLYFPSLFASINISESKGLIEDMKAVYRFLSFCFGTMAKEYILGKIKEVK